MVLEILLVATALVLCGALAGYLYHQRVVTNRYGGEVAGMGAVRRYLTKAYGITLSEDDCEQMVHPAARIDPEPKKMLPPAP